MYEGFYLAMIASFINLFSFETFYCVFNVSNVVMFNFKSHEKPCIVKCTCLEPWEFA